MEQIEKIQGTEKEFIKVFQELCYSRSSWQVWADLMAAMACTLANSVDRTLPRHTAREKEYAECIDRLGGVEKPAKCFAIVVEALEHNPDQDFLGKLYMSLELGNHWKGQFFTPYNVCECCTISYGYIFYGETRHRMKVEFTDEVREKVRKIFTEMHKYYEQRYTPKVKTSKKCNACSLKDICIPVLNKKKSVSGYIDRIIAEEEKE